MTEDPTGDINFEDLNEYIPDDGFEHDSKSMDCPCGPTLEFVMGIGGGLVHRDMSVGDTFPERWIENIDPPATLDS